jgi:hypothetical protein
MKRHKPDVSRREFIGSVTAAGAARSGLGRVRTASADSQARWTPAGPA